MSDLSNFDLPDLADIPSPEDISQVAPKGVYELTVRDADARDSRDGLPMLWWDFEVTKNEAGTDEGIGVRLWPNMCLAIWADKSDPEMGTKAPPAFMLADFKRLFEVLNIDWQVMKDIYAARDVEERNAIFQAAVVIGSTFIAKLKVKTETYEGEERERNHIASIPPPGTVAI